MIVDGTEKLYNVKLTVTEMKIIADSLRDFGQEKMESFSKRHNSDYEVIKNTAYILYVQLKKEVGIIE